MANGPRWKPKGPRWIDMQLCQARGWEAVCRGKDGTAEGRPIACWVVQMNPYDPSETRVIGLADHGGILAAVEDEESFLRYQPIQRMEGQP